MYLGAKMGEGDDVLKVNGFTTYFVEILMILPIPIDFSASNRYWWSILTVGIGLGVANHFLGIWPSLGQSLVVQVVMSILIGYPLLVIGFNEYKWWPQTIPVMRRQVILALAFLILGFTASELQILADNILFETEGYAPFQGGGVYIFNGILTIIIGFSTLNIVIPQSKKSHADKERVAVVDANEAALTTIPMKKGDVTVFAALEDVKYFEAYDNYSFLYDTGGRRTLCNHSLAQLEPRLTSRFLRVHRKYLVNIERIKSIAPYQKGRYTLTFSDQAKDFIVTSSGYSDVVKELTRI